MALAEAVADQPLDFLAFFSSANAVFGNPGQANYVAGCRFKDAYAAHLRGARGLPALTIDWGYWGEVGVVATPELRTRLAQQGILPISVAEGLGAFERALCDGAPQLIPVAGTAEAFTRLGVEAVPAEHGLDRVLAEAQRAQPGTPALAEEERAFAAVERVAAAGLARGLAGMGFMAGGPKLAVEDWATALGVVEARRPLLAACLDILARSGLAEAESTGVRPRPSAPSAGVEREHVSAAAPQLAPHLALLDNCLAALPEVLRGRASGLEALMPGGSAALIEAVYAGGAAATDRLGGLVAACVAAWAGALPDHRPVRVLEVGGGTGGTTRLVVPALAAVRPGAEYLFTDVSPSFLSEAARRFAATLPGFATARLDISADPAAQGRQLGGFDIVLAADVLHATPDLARSLAHCRRLLRAGGLLVLNETTRVRDFATLTFGLTDGWWCASDRARRLPFGPAAAAETWRELLAEAGFAAQRSLPPERAAPDAFQTLFVAEAGPDAEAPRSANALRVAAAPVAATDPLHAHLAALVGATLKLDPAALHPAEPFGTYGLESVMALEVIAALEADFGTLPKTLLFEAASIADLADWLRRENPSAAAAIHARERGVPPVPLPSTPAAAAVPANANDLIEGAIAVVALAGRFPGARSPEALWELLREGRSAITEVPAERWDHAPHYDPTRTDDTKAHSKWGGFVDGADRFDAALFHISPAEARATDPMERQFIEVAWELLENAGHAPERLKAAARNPLGGDVGVFVGVMSQTYEQLATEIWAKGVYTGAFSSHSSIANRVSFLFDFTGPSCGVDTACSSSLTAVHLACEAIRRGDCRAAIAGGVNLLLHPLHHILLSAYRVLSPDNRTRAFGEGGTGFVVGEGIGAVLLRPLADALRDGDPVLAVVRGSAVNTSGRTSSYSAPSVEAQAAVVTAALARAGVDPRSIGCVEAHGTGTELGDPVEIRALAKAWSAWTADRGFCAIGSVKSNIGHLECAAGIAGLAKLLLQFRHRTLAPSLDAEPPNPHLDLGATPFRVQTRLGAWDPPADGGPRRAAISSFGLGGANAHLVLEEWPVPPPGATDDGAPLLVPISARTEERLRAHLARLAGHLRQALAAGDAPSLRDVAWTLQVGRQALPERWAAVATDVPGFVDAAEGWLQGRVSPGVRHGRVGRVGHSAHAGDPPHPSLAADPAAMAAHWVAGGRIEPERLLRGERRPRIVPLPNYPFEPRRFWLTDGKGFSKAEVSASRAAERAAPQATEPVAAYYDATLPVREDRLDEAYFSLAPFAEPRPGFSWTRTVLDPEAEPEAAATLLEAQRAMRRALLAGLDLADGPRRVLDIGCGAATDLIALARANPRLTAHGRTLAAEHARVAAARVRLAGLADRVAIEVGDSAGSPFPGPPFDLVLGIEVVHHVRDKDALFGNIAAALAPAGRVALADCVAPRVAVSVAETGSFTLAEPAYAELLARHGLRIMRAVDASAGVAHCLADEGLPQVLAHLAARGLPAARLELVRRSMRAGRTSAALWRKAASVTCCCRSDRTGRPTPPGSRRRTARPSPPPRRTPRRRPSARTARWLRLCWTAWHRCWARPGRTSTHTPLSWSKGSTASAGSASWTPWLAAWT